MSDAVTLGQAMLGTFETADPVESLKQVTAYREHMMQPTTGMAFVAWISEPPNLLAVHQNLVKHLTVPPKLLAIKRANMSRVRRAVLLMQAMESGIKRTHKL